MMTVHRRRGRTYLFLCACGLPSMLACGALLAPEGTSDPSDASPDSVAVRGVDAGGDETVEKDAAAGADSGLDAGPDVGGDAMASTDAGQAFDGGVTCAPPPAPVQLPPPARGSGTRLTLRTLGEAAPLGVEVAEDIYDTGLGRRCFPMRYTDGTIRCVPELPIAEPCFADPALTQPIALASRTSASAPEPGDLYLSQYGQANPYAYWADPFGCAATMHLDALGAQRSSQSYYDAKGTLRAVNPGAAMYDLVPLAPDLVTLQVVDTRLAGDIAIRELHGTDGSRLFAQYLYDTRHGVAVSVTQGRCLPPPAWTPGHLSPPPAGTATKSWCDAPEPIFGLACGSPAFVRDGAQTFAVTPQTRTLYSCRYDMESRQPFGFNSSTVPLLISCGALPFTDWTAAAPLTLGNGRVTTQAVSIGGARFAPPVLTYDERRVRNAQRVTEVGGRTFFDTALGTACAAAPSTEDGLMHCFPQPALRAAYSDAACTNPIAVGDQVPASNYALEAVGRDGIAHAFNVGAPLGQMHAFYTPDEWSSCDYYDYTAVQPFYAFAATPVSVGTFAELQLRSVP
jgi:hypothetical protein